MYSVNENYLKLPGSYLFSNIAKKVAAFSAANPDAPIIRLGIGDVTQPLAPAIALLKNSYPRSGAYPWNVSACAISSTAL